jgi:hypothetical protein
MTDNVTRRAFSALRWGYLGILTRNSASFGIGILLARPLGPKPLGQVATAMVAVRPGESPLRRRFRVGSRAGARSHSEADSVRLHRSGSDRMCGDAGDPPGGDGLPRRHRPAGAGCHRASLSIAVFLALRRLGEHRQLPQSAANFKGTGGGLMAPFPRDMRSRRDQRRNPQGKQA